MLTELYARGAGGIPMSAGMLGADGPFLFEWTAGNDGAQSQQLPAAPSFCTVCINGLLQSSDYSTDGTTLTLSAALHVLTGDRVSCLYWS